MGWDELMETLKSASKSKGTPPGRQQVDRHGRHQPFGHGGYNPQGIRIGGRGQEQERRQVWEQRAYRDYDDQQELGTRNIKVALRRLRKFAREGHELELDLPTPSAARPPTPGISTSKWCPSATTT